MLVLNLDGTTKPLNHNDVKTRSKARELRSDLCGEISRFGMAELQSVRIVPHCDDIQTAPKAGIQKP
jgi:hypothetical protein